MWWRGGRTFRQSNAAACVCKGKERLGCHMLFSDEGSFSLTPWIYVFAIGIAPVLLRLFLSTGLCAGAYHKWTKIVDDYFRHHDAQAIQGIYMGPTEEPELMIVVPIYSAGKLILKMRRDGNLVALDYAVSGVNFCKVMYKPTQAVLDFLFDVLKQVDSKGPEMFSKDLVVMVESEPLTETDWKKRLKDFVGFEGEQDSSSEPELPEPKRSSKAGAAAKAKPGPKKPKQLVAKRPACLKRPSSQR